MSTTPAGWYPDPSVAGQVRYFDGQGWTEHTQPTPQAIAAPQAPPLPAMPGYDQTPAVAPYQQQPHQVQQPQQQPQQYQQPQQQPQQAQPPQQQFNQAPQPSGQPQATAVNQIMINNVAAVPVGPQKNVAVAILLAFFFGPLGLLYATVQGGLIMLLIAIVSLPFVFLAAIPQFFVWVGCMVWAGVAVSNQNKAAVMASSINAGVMTAPQQPAIQQQPQQYQQQAQPQQYAPPAALPQQTGAPNPYQQGTPAEQQVPPPR
ncbi:unannotated protein [freshwater metagenome]|uniref:Unannotated protein n=1 Tax=freshwater metagenome TaxID=449393 RepID=A0A6J7SAB1_9ZZZZ